MPIWFVNPSKRKKPRRRFVLKAKAHKAKKHSKRRKLFGAALMAHLKKSGKSLKRRHRKAAVKRRVTAAPKKRSHAMAKRRKRKKLFGAALAAHQKKHGGGKKRRAKKRRSSKRRARASISVRINPRRRRRRAHAKRRNPRRHRRMVRHTFAAKRRTNPRRKYRRVKHRRSNPRRHRRYHRNPLRLGGIGGVFMNAVKAALPVGAGFFGTNAASTVIGNYTAKLLPVSMLPYQDPILKAAALFGLNILTNKVGPLKKYKNGIMVGAGLSLVNSLLETFAPSVKGYLTGRATGVLPTSGYMAATADYVEQTGDIGDYVQQNGIQEDLGAFFSDTGAEHDLGSLLAPVKKAPNLIEASSQSSSYDVPDWEPSMSRGDSLYTGVFAGGFGN